ncbi:MAG: hypothetical protein AAB075_10175 [Gemmatimonadota bacterium]
MIRRLCLFLTVLLIPALPGVLVSQETLLTPASYLDYETVADPGFSPDGKVIVYTRRWINTLEDRFESALWIMDGNGGRNRFFTKGGNPVWSPDGTRVAYLAEGEPKGTQIFVRWVDRDGPPTQVTREEYPPSNIGWSPDGRSIAFARFVPKTSAWKIEMPAAPKDAKWTAPPRFVDRLHYRQDRIGYTSSPTGTGGRTPISITGTPICSPSMWRAVRSASSPRSPEPGIGRSFRPTGRPSRTPDMRRPERATGPRISI